MSLEQPKPPCDCLNWCGDDAWLNDGRAEPCQARKDRERRELEAAIERRNILATANRLADAALEHGSVMVAGDVMDEIRGYLVRTTRP